MKTLDLLITEAMGGRSQMMADKIIQMAEANAYDVGAEEGNVNLDMVYDEAKRILSEIENTIAEKLQSQFDQNTPK